MQGIINICIVPMCLYDKSLIIPVYTEHCILYSIHYTLYSIHNIHSTYSKCIIALYFQVRCNTYFELEGESETTCSPNGWTAPRPYCRGYFASFITSVNGVIMSDNTPYTAVSHMLVTAHKNYSMIYAYAVSSIECIDTHN